MTIGANSNRDELVRTLRGMQFSKLNLGFLKGEDLDGKQREGYDRYGKYEIRFGAAIVWIICFAFAVLVFQSFFPRATSNFDDELYVWTRSNLFWTVPIWSIAVYFLLKSEKRRKLKPQIFFLEPCQKTGLLFCLVELDFQATW